MISFQYKIGMILSGIEVELREQLLAHHIELAFCHQKEYTHNTCSSSCDKTTLFKKERKEKVPKYLLVHEN